MFRELGYHDTSEIFFYHGIPGFLGGIITAIFVGISKDLKEKPEISQKSKEIINNKNKKENLFERMKEKERIANEKKIKLKEKINLERAKKKEEEDKPLEFKTHLKPNNQKFNKVYYEMKRKNDKKKEDFKIFAEVVRQYEIRECKFQPNLNDEDIEEGETKRAFVCFGKGKPSC